MARFDLEGFKRGESCYAMNGMRATYLFTMKNVPAPIIVLLMPFDNDYGEYDETVESYTIKGDHLIDGELNLVSGIFISHNEISPTHDKENVDVLDVIYEQRQKAEWIEKSMHNNYYLF